MLRVLLDTSFLFPSLGVEAGREVKKGVKSLDGFGGRDILTSFQRAGVALGGGGVT